MKRIILLAFIIVIGIGVTIYSIYNNKLYKEKDAKYIEATATVIDYDYKIDEEGTELAAIIAEYTIDREAYQYKGTTYSTNPIPLGTTITIKYNPNDPSDAILPNDHTGIIAIIVGVGFIVLGTIGLIIEIKNKM